MVAQTVVVVALIVGLILFIIMVSRAIRIVRPYEKGVVERLGRYKTTLEPGLHFIFPLMDHLAKVDMRENVVDVPPQEVITEDNVVVTVDAVVYYEATDPVKLLYNVADFYTASTKLAQTNLRNIIGDMQLDESLTSREKINVALRQILDDATDKWGVRVVRVELQRIEPPVDVTQAMHRQMKAERDKRALILEAEGDRQAAINRAEGAKQSAILEAEGRATAIREVADAEKFQKLTVAEGEAQAIETVYAAIHRGEPTNDLLAVRYIDTLRAMGDGKATKIFLPYEASSVMASIAGIAELFGDKGTGKPSAPGEPKSAPATPATPAPPPPRTAGAGPGEAPQPGA